MTPLPAASLRRACHSRAQRTAVTLTSLLAGLMTASAPVRAQAPADVDFTKLSLEELMDVEQVERAAYGKLTLRF